MLQFVNYLLNMMFQKVIVERSLSKKIATQIEQAILDKKLPVGSKIPSENELCEQFGVSRTSIREAIKILNAHGLVEIKKGVGIFVKEITSDSVSDGMKKFYEHRLGSDYKLDLIHARQVLEPGIAYYAAISRTDEDLKNLRYDIEQIEAGDNDPEQHTKYDIQFHLDLANATQNPLLVLMIKPLHKMMPDIKSQILQKVKDAHEVGNVWHRRIYDEVEKKNPDAAKEAMLKHLLIAEQHIKLVIE